MTGLDQIEWVGLIWIDWIDLDLLDSLNWFDETTIKGSYDWIDLSD
jgi:hypothetical protein